PCLCAWRRTSSRAGRPACLRVAGTLPVRGCLLTRRLGGAIRHVLRRLDRLLTVDRFRRSHHPAGPRRGLSPRNHGQPSRVNDGQDPRDVFADLADLPVVVELAHGELETELVQLPTRPLEPAVQLVGVQRLQFVRLHLSALPACTICGSITDRKPGLIGTLGAARALAYFG